MKIVNIKFLQMLLALVLVLGLVSACAPIEVPTDNSGVASSTDPSASVADGSEEQPAAESSSESVKPDDETSEAVSDETSESQESSEETSEALSADESSEDISEPVSEDSSEESSQSAGEFFPPVEGKAVAFTFDDGPSYVTDKILDYCEEKGIKVTFFVVGNRVGAENGARMQRAISLGCEVGNHSYNHPSYTSLPVSVVVNDQIRKTNSIIEKYTGIYPTLMRPPYGNYTKELAEKVGMNVIMWSVDTLDWSYKNTEKIVEHSYSEIGSGDIVLMHDLYETTYEAFVIMADKLIAEGYQLVTVSELLGSEKLVDKTFYFGFGY